jgi:hypothetical protein
MATWEDLERMAPEMAAAGRKLLYQYGQPLAYLATIRKDGGPRIHPFCPTIVAGSVYAFIGPSPKQHDLSRDGRFALHTFPCKGIDDEFLLIGRATTVHDQRRLDAVRKDLEARGVKTGDEGQKLFEFKIERAMHAEYGGPPGTWPPKYAVWKAPNGA